MPDAASAVLLCHVALVVEVEVLMTRIADDGSFRTLVAVVAHEQSVPVTCTCQHYMMQGPATLHHTRQYILAELALLHIAAQQNLAVGIAERLGQID